jgi:adenylate cyclase
MLILAQHGVNGHKVAARYGSMGESSSINDSATMDSVLAGELESDDRRECAIPVSYGGATIGVLWLRRAANAPPFGATDQPLLAFLANQTAVILENNRLFEQYLVQQREQYRLRGMLEQYLAPSMVEQLIDGPADLQRKGDLVPVSILMADIRGSTALINAIAPNTMIDLLNEFFARMIDILFAYEGTIEKFVGDGVHGFFGAPVAHGDDPQRAVRAAVAMQNAFAALVAERGGPYALPASLAIGIGVATGEVVVGNVGSSKRLAYTMLGPAANLAARLTAAAPAGTIHLDERTWAAAAVPLGLRPRRPRHLRAKGFDGLVPVYRLRAADMGVDS